MLTDEHEGQEVEHMVPFFLFSSLVPNSSFIKKVVCNAFIFVSVIGQNLEGC